MTVIREIAPRRATKAEQIRVRDWVRKYRKEFYLDIVVITLIFNDYPADDSDVDLETEDGALATMDSNGLERYHRATLQVYPQFFDEDLEDQEFCIVHEMAHLLVSPLKDLVIRLRNGELVTHAHLEDVDEEVTDRIARAMHYGGSANETQEPIRTIKPAAGKSKVTAKSARDAARKDRK